MEKAFRQLGRYLLFDEIAVGGMAAVHLGRVLGPAGFSRTVAIKRLHPQYARDPEFAAMFLDEARLAARIHHPNVVAILDVVARDGELFLVMEYVQGESLSRLVRASAEAGLMPVPVVLALLVGVLYGLHAAHEATNERKDPLALVHRDVSPQNVLVGVDGVARVLDFGIAKAATRIHSTRDGQLKGKLAYMAPEQIRRENVDRRTDIYAAGVVLWEALTGTRLFKPGDPAALVNDVLTAKIPEPGSLRPELSAELNAIVMKATDSIPSKRFDTAMQMAAALEGVGVLASPREVGEWVRRLAEPSLRERAQKVADIESSSSAPLDLSVLSRATPNVSPEARTDVLFENDAPSLGTDAQLSTDASAPVPPRSSRTSLFIVTAATLALGALSFLWFSRSPDSKIAAAPPVGSEPLPRPTLTPTSLGMPSASAKEAPDANADVPSKPAKPNVRPVSRPVKPKPPNCNPPYVMDPDGTRRYKAECI